MSLARIGEVAVDCRSSGSESVEDGWMYSARTAKLGRQLRRFPQAATCHFPQELSRLEHPGSLRIAALDSSSLNDEQETGHRHRLLDRRSGVAAATVTPSDIRLPRIHVDPCEEDDNASHGGAIATAAGNVTRHRKGGCSGCQYPDQYLLLPQRKVGRVKAPSPLSLFQEPSAGSQGHSRRRSSSEPEAVRFMGHFPRSPKTSTDSTSSVESTDSVSMAM